MLQAPGTVTPMASERDCPHGHQLGKCDSCDLIDAEAEIKRLRGALLRIDHAWNDCYWPFGDDPTVAANVERLSRIINEAGAGGDPDA